MRMDVAWMLAAAVVAAGCGKSPAGPDGPTDHPPSDSPSDGPSDGPGVDVPPHIPGMPGAGAHGMRFYHLGDPSAPSTSSITTPAMTTQATGSTIVVSVGRGDDTLFALPTDTRGNAPYQQQGQMHPYARWPDSGTALYAFPSARGGTGFQVTTSTGDNARGQLDEVTLAAVEVIEGTRIKDAQWIERTSPPLTSPSVTTDGPATLVAFWWGDGFPDTTPQTASPNNGFVVVDTNVEQLHSYVQCAVAVKNVKDPGSYNVTWTATPVQGAQPWLIAVQ
ncbi:MAG: hypothetical protein E6J91_04570 [Deltaproteobacteria bacterium]|nr:MAG: hypothetical protein E6J91_04570 [Deltaproteobacteria bacterium]